MPDIFRASYSGHFYELYVGEEEACAIQYSPTDGSYEARWFPTIKDAMSWWGELNEHTL